MGHDSFDGVLGAVGFVEEQFAFRDQGGEFLFLQLGFDGGREGEIVVFWVEFAVREVHVYVAVVEVVLGEGALKGPGRVGVAGEREVGGAADEGVRASGDGGGGCGAGVCEVCIELAERSMGAGTGGARGVGEGGAAATAGLDGAGGGVAVILEGGSAGVVGSIALGSACVVSAGVGAGRCS